jgi:hypothetical protein
VRKSVLTNLLTPARSLGALLKCARSTRRRREGNRRDELLEKYAEHGDAQFVLPDILKVPPISAHGQVSDIVKTFGGADKLCGAVKQLQSLLYAA